MVLCQSLDDMVENIECLNLGKVVETNINQVA